MTPEDGEPHSDRDGEGAGQGQQRTEGQGQQRSEARKVSAEAGSVQEDRWEEGDPQATGGVTSNGHLHRLFRQAFSGKGQALLGYADGSNSGQITRLFCETGYRSKCYVLYSPFNLRPLLRDSQRVQ